MLSIVIIAAVVFGLLAYISKQLISYPFKWSDKPTIPRKPESVNYHFTRQCNYACGFCFHTAKTSFVLPVAEAKQGLKMLKEAGGKLIMPNIEADCIPFTAGLQKINFSGGEPFIHQKGKYLGELVQYCKVNLELPSVSIVSNGSLITEEWFQDYGECSNR